MRTEKEKEELLLPRAARLHDVSYKEVGSYDDTRNRGGGAGGSRSGGKAARDAVGDPIPGAAAGAYTRPLFSSTGAVSGTKYTINTPSYTRSPPHTP